MSHSLQTSTLRFGYEALEPSIDAETMELHHDKHHHAYVESLNAALAPYPHLADLDIDDLRGRLAGCPSKSARLCATMAAVTPITRCSGRSWLRTRAARADAIAPRLRLVRAVSDAVCRRRDQELRLGMDIPRRRSFSSRCVHPWRGRSQPRCASPRPPRARFSRSRTTMGRSSPTASWCRRRARTPWRVV